MRLWSPWLIGLAAAHAACVTPARSAKPEGLASLDSFETGRRAGLPLVLAIMPPSTATIEVLKSLRDEISSDFDLATLSLHEEMTADDLRAELQALKPDCLVLMNNPTVKLYRAYQRASAPGTAFPPAVVVMAAYLEEVQDGLENATGIAYEVPAPTIFRNLRSLIDRPVDRVGVVYRRPFARFIARQRKLAAEERIELVGVELDSDASPSDVRRAIETLREDHRVHALWVLNDNQLLGKSKMFSKGWLPTLEDEPLPVVVGVGSLVRSDRTFGSFAMLPDHTALGVQASNIIFELAASDWNAADRRVEQPLSVQTVIDLTAARKNLAFREEMLGRIDRVVE